VAEVVFADPLGNDFQVVALDRLLHLVRTKKERYWNSPSSSGSARSITTEGGGPPRTRPTPLSI